MAGESTETKRYLETYIKNRKNLRIWLILIKNV